MRKISLFLLIFGLIAVGCDSNDDGDADLTDAEQFEGVWVLASLTADGEPVQLEDYTAVEATFNSDDSFTLFLEGGEGFDDLTLSGTWSLNESTGVMTLNASVPGLPTSIPLAFDYEIDGDNRRLIAGPQTTAALNGVLGTTLTAPVVFTVVPA